MSRPSLDERIAALREAAELGRERLGAEQLAQLDAVIEQTTNRRSLSAEHTVVGFFGATGSGKSSLFNAVTGEQLARAHVRRPTTSEPLAAVWNPAGAEPLLDWLQVRDRRLPATAFDGDRELSLILLDLPDFDSVEATHRQIAQRLAGQVDVLVWVVDPQKYADAVIHADFIRPFAGHRAVTSVVLNQIDLLAPAQRRPVADSLGALLDRDGLREVRVLPVSAVTGEGIAELRQVIARFARQRRAAGERLAADVQRVAAQLLPEAGGAGQGRAAVPRRQQDELTRALAAAAGVDEVARAVGRSYARRAGLHTGWPLTSWLLRLRPDPLRRLHLEASAPRSARRTGRDPELHRTSLPPLSAGQQALASRAVREYTDRASDGLPEDWRAGARLAANSALDTLPGELDRAIARTDLGARGSWWWGIVQALQWLALLAALGGVGWYLAAWLLPLWGFPAPEVLAVEGWPVPGLLVVGGILLGILLGLASGAVGAVVGAFRRRRAGRRLRREVEQVARRLVVAPVDAEITRASRVAALLRTASGL